jgi:hypothetical protein
VALLLSEADKLDVADFARGVVRHIINRDPVSGKLVLRETEEGDQFEWNRQNTIGSATPVDPNEDLSATEAASTFSAQSVNLRIYVREARVDNFIQMTRSKATSQARQQLNDAMQAISEKFLDDFYYGDNSTNSKQFSGIHKLTDDTNQSIDESSGALNMTNFDTMLYENAKIRLPGGFLVTSAEMYRRFMAALRDTSVLGTVNWTPENVATEVVNIGGYPLHLSDFLVSGAETDVAVPSKTGGDESSIFLLFPGDVEDGGLSVVVKGGLLQTVFFPSLENYDAVKWRLKFYAALADGSRYSINRIRSIDSAASIAA